MIIKFFKKFYNVLFSTVDKRVGYYIILICWLKKRNQRFFGLIVCRRLQRKYGVFLPYAAQFNSSLILRHPIGIIIGEGVEISDNVIIFQNVTLGRSDTYVDSYPCIGENTIIYSGAVILGDIKIGKNCIIGANAVVTKDVADNSISVGVPARSFLRKD